MMWKDGRPYGRGLCETERNLLIGYDMMPLRGLEQTERVLQEEGIIAMRTAVIVSSEEERDCYAVTVNGQFEVDPLEFSVCHDQREQVFKTLLVYYGRDRLGFTSDRAGTLSVEEGNLCNRYWWFRIGGGHKDGRRRSTHAKLRQAVEEIFDRHQIHIVPIAYRMLEEV